MENPSEILLRDVERFLEETGMPPATFGVKAVHDPNFVRNLRSGRQPRFNTVKRVIDFIHGEKAA